MNSRLAAACFLCNTAGKMRTTERGKAGSSLTLCCGT
jgi:hypothetical protein